MNIEFEFKDKRTLIKFCGEYTGIFLNRHKILKKKKGRAKNYNHNKIAIKAIVILFVLWFLSTGIFIYDVMINNFQHLLLRRSTFFFIIMTTILVTLIFQLKKTYKEILKTLHQKGVLTVTSDKITCNYNERELSTALEKINGIVIGKYSINVITDNNAVFNLPINTKDKVISAIKKYKNDVLIIELK